MLATSKLFAALCGCVIAADCPNCDTELGGLQDPQWPVLRQAMHQAVLNLTKTAVIANSDMGDDRYARNEFTLHFLVQISLSIDAWR